MSWLRANWKHVLLVLALLVTVSGWISTAHYRGVAKAEAATAARQTEQLEDLQTALRSLRIRNAELAAELELEVLEEEDVAEDLQEAREENDVAAAELDEEVAEVAELHAGWIPIGIHEQRLAAARRDAELADEIAESERRRRLLLEPHVCVGCREEIAELQELVAGLEDRDATRLRQIAALERAVAPSFAVKLVDNWELVALGVLVGVVGWELAR